MLIFFISNSASAQLLQINKGAKDNEARKISFYSNNEGYIAFKDFIGYTTDAGKNYSIKRVSFNNVNYNGYEVNLTFGFSVNGIKAFNKNKIIVYGHYALVPAILLSTDGGTNFKLVFHNQLSMVPNSTVTDMVFPQNGAVGYAVDFDRILKTIDGGQSWTAVKTNVSQNYIGVQAFDENTVYAASFENGVLKTANGGLNWQGLGALNATINSFYFLNQSIGWASGHSGVYSTKNGGSSWQKIDAPYHQLDAKKMIFTDEDTGFAIINGTDLHKTTDGGKIWEPLRNENFDDKEYPLKDFQLLGQTIWVAGSDGYIALSTTGGGAVIPKAVFSTDLSDINNSDAVKLINYSKPEYTYQWFLNGIPLSTDYNTSFPFDATHRYELVKLTVSNGVNTSSAEKNIELPVVPIVFSVTPLKAGKGTTITITGKNFNNITKVTFGDAPAASYKINSSESITAIIGNGASGNVIVHSSQRKGSKPGFEFIPAPIINNFTPVNAKPGTTIIISGKNFTGTTGVSFGGTPAKSFELISSTRINAVVGNGSGGKIAIITPGGTALADGFSIVPVVKSFSPASGTNGTVMHIDGSGFDKLTQITLGNIPVRSFKIDSLTGITAIVGHGSTGPIKVNNAAGFAEAGIFTYFNPPVISSVMPLTGKIGETITITGSNFSTIAIENIVHFGAVRATVLTANNSTLTVKVPVGAISNFITVTTHHLTGRSRLPFNVTFDGSGSISPKSFIAADSLITNASSIAKTLVADIDNDGKSDLAAIGDDNQSIVVLLNNSNPGLPRYTSHQIELPGPYAVNTNRMFISDINGDGKPDLVCSNSAAKISVYINQSSPGNISFTFETVPETELQQYLTGVADADHDGKPDIIYSYYPSESIGGNVFLSKSEPGEVKFNDPVNYTGMPDGDIDGDNKDETLLLPYDGGIYYTYIDNSTPGNIAYKPNSVTVVTAIYQDNKKPVFADIDGDGRLDAVAIDYRNTILIAKNISQPGTGAFEKPQKYQTELGPRLIAIDDFDGDGKPDIACIYVTGNQLTIFKNLSVPGKIIMGQGVTYKIGPDNEAFTQLITFDVNLDGRTDLLIRKGNAFITAINKTAKSPFIASFSPLYGVPGTKVNLKGLNFNAATSVSFGGVSAASFQVISDTEITAIVGNGAVGSVKVTNKFDSSSLKGFSYGLFPVIQSFSPAFGDAGTQVIIKGENFDPNAKKNVVYFGDVRAEVVASTTGTITVVAPQASLYKPITVTTANRVASSVAPFRITYRGDEEFTGESFSVRDTIADAGGIQTGDLDGDGKLDIFYLRLNGDRFDLYVARNKGIRDSVAFDKPLIIGTNLPGPAKCIADLDGDGKPEIICLTRNGSVNDPFSNIFIYRNTSAAGKLSFNKAIKVVDDFISRGLFVAGSLYTGDMDGDGLIDIVLSNVNGSFTFFRNETSGRQIKFASRFDISFEGGLETVTELNDFNNDGKPDVLVYRGLKADILKNTSTPGNFTFQNEKTIDLNGSIFVSDFDNDGKWDIADTGRDYFGKTTFYRNTSTKDQLSFATTTASNVAGFTDAADLNGDGKIDITFMNSSYNFGILKGNSSPGNISITNEGRLTLGSGIITPFCADLDNDGKTDIVLSSTWEGAAIIIRNKHKKLFELPGSNFKVNFQQISCKGSNNGSIIIASDSTLNFRATITNDNGFSRIVPFTKTTSVTELVAGKYTVCITVNGQPDYNQCFTGTIAEPRDISLFTLIDHSTQKLTLKLDGADTYFIDLNGESFQTNQSEYTLNLKKGNNIVTVNSDKQCQGSKIQRISIGNEKTVYPNPFNSLVNIDFAQSEAIFSNIEVFDLMGRRVYSKNEKITYGIANLYLAHLKTGMYIIKLSADNTQSLFKVWKN